MKLHHSVLPIAMLLALSGCNSDGSQSAGSNTGTPVAPQDFSGISFSYNASPMSVETAQRIQLTEENSLEFARLALVKATAYAVNGLVNSRNLSIAEQLFSIDESEITETCPGGGSLRLTKGDLNSNSEINPQDFFTASFAQCNNSNGRLRTDFVTYDGSTDSGVLATNHFVTASEFKAEQPSTGNSGQADGAEGRRILLSSGRFQYIAHAPANKLKEIEGGQGEASYTSNAYLDVQGRLAGDALTVVRMNYKESGDVSTRLELPTEAAYTAFTDSVNVSISDSAVESGSIEVKSAGVVRIEALGNSSGRYRLRIQLDSNEDGVNDRSCDFDYSAVLNGTASFGSQQCVVSPPEGPDSNPLANVPLLGPLLSPILSPILGTLIP